MLNFDKNNTEMSNHQSQAVEAIFGTITSIWLMVPAWLEGVEFVIKMTCLILSGVASYMTIRKLKRKK